MGASASQPSLQEYGGRAGVFGLRAPGSARQLGGEAFVVELNRHIEPIPQPLDEGAGLARLLGVRPRQRERKPHDDDLRLERADHGHQAAEAAARGRLEHRVERRRQGAGRIRDREAAARAAVVERDDAAQASACRTASSAARSASGSLSGSRPPACAMVSRPPPPPPTTWAAALTTSPAFTPRSTAPGVAATSRLTRPSPGTPRTTTAGSPSFPLILSAASGSSFGLLNCFASMTTWTPLTSVEVKSTSSGSAVAVPFSSSRRRASRSAATAGTWWGWVRRIAAVSARCRSLRRSSSIATGPVIASMRRTLAALEVSVVTLKAPISAVARTWVPPHSSRDHSPSPTSTIRTTSPYFSPNRAIAPRLRASSSVVVSARTGWLARIHSLTRSSTAATSSRDSGAPWVKSKRSLSGPTYEPAWRTWPPWRSRSAACRRWVAVWLH